MDLLVADAKVTNRSINACEILDIRPLRSSRRSSPCSLSLYRIAANRYD